MAFPWLSASALRETGEGIFQGQLEGHLATPNLEDRLACSLHFSAFHSLPRCCCCCRQVASVVSDSCDPMDCSLPGSSIHGIFQAGVLEWGAIAFSAATMRQHQSQDFLYRDYLEPPYLQPPQYQIFDNQWSCGISAGSEGAKQRNRFLPVWSPTYCYSQKYKIWGENITRLRQIWVTFQSCLLLAVCI